jgi:hypothetical protein
MVHPEELGIVIMEDVGDVMDQQGVERLVRASSFPYSFLRYSRGDRDIELVKRRGKADRSSG